MTKTPTLFKKPIPKAKFEKNYLRYIEQPADKEFLRSSFTLNDSGLYTLKEVSKEDAARLKTLAKAIVSNRAWSIKVVPLAACAITAAGAIFFFTIIMNPLLERALESALENIFEARSDVNSFKLNLLRFRISIGAIIVANKEKPMQNLFEINRIEFRLLPQAVLRGKIYIEEMRADGISFDTPRKTSGALARFASGSEAKQKKAAKADAPPLIDVSKFDPAALLDRERDKMQSFKLYDDAISLYTTTEETWKSRIDSAKTRTAELNDAAKPFLNLNLNSIDVRNPESIKQLLKLVDDAKNAQKTVQTAVNDANSILTGVQSDIQSALTLKKNAETAVKDDINRLKSYIDLKGGGYHQILDPILEEILSATAQQYISYGRTALNALEKLKAYQALLPKKTEKPKEAAFRGRDVAFPTPNYPFFYLGTLATDITIEGWKGSFDLRSVSSEPELVNKPVSLALKLKEVSGPQIWASFDGTAELRSSKQELFSAQVQAGNFPVSVKNELGSIGIEGFSAQAAFDVSAAGNRDNTWNANIKTKLTNPELSGIEGIVAGAIKEAVTEAGMVDIGARFEHTNAKDNFNLETNIGELIMSALKKTATAYINKALAALETEMRSRLAPYLEKMNIKQGELDSLSAAARGDKAALDKLSGVLNEKINEMERKARGAAEEKAANAVNNAMKGLFGGR